MAGYPDWRKMFALDDEPDFAPTPGPRADIDERGMPREYSQNSMWEKGGAGLGMIGEALFDSYRRNKFEKQNPGAGMLPLENPASLSSPKPQEKKKSGGPLDMITSMFGGDDDEEQQFPSDNLIPPAGRWIT